MLVAFFATSLLLVTSGIVLMLLAIARQILMPAISRLRDPAKEGDSATQYTFVRLHWIGVTINAAQMVLLFVATVYLVRLL